MSYIIMAIDKRNIGGNVYGCHLDFGHSVPKLKRSLKNSTIDVFQRKEDVEKIIESIKKEQTVYLCDSVNNKFLLKYNIICHEWTDG